MTSEDRQNGGEMSEAAFMLVRDACIDAALEAYQAAAMCGLCHEGAWEAAVSAMRMLHYEAVFPLKDLLKND